jgi:tRNA threonylcarbamoyladenosine biosynthesis protein TsaE
MQNEFITTSSIQTKKLGAMLAQELRGGEIVCLIGELGAGKTTFTQGLLKGLKVKGPYTSPTFSIIKHYRKEITNHKSQITNKFKIQNSKFKILNIYHIDAYRIASKELLDLGWKDFAGKPDSIVIIEWAERVKKLIPSPPAGGALWISFEWINDKERKILLSNNLGLAHLS